MKTIDREELRAKLDRGDNFRLVMALPARAFKAAHIPGSLNFETPEDAMRVLKPTEEIVVYCSDAPCVASQIAYRRLVEHGYLKVRRYSGGLSDWLAAGYPLEGGSAD